MCMDAHLCSFCKLYVMFSNVVRDNKLETAASRFNCIYTFQSNFNDTLHTIVMHGRAAANISLRLGDELPKGELC